MPSILFIPLSQLWAGEPIDGMYFSYYSNKEEIAKLEFNIAEKNISNIKLYIKYINMGTGFRIREDNISCSARDVGTRDDFPPIFMI